MFHREAHEVKPREALTWVCIWVSAALAFCGVLYFWRGPDAAGEFLAGYLIEQSLSVDNMFVFALIFGYFAVPGKFQHRLLFWGIVGAVIFRAMFIGAGAVLLKNFHWTIYLFGAFLVFTGLKLLRHNDEDIEPEKNPVLRLIRRFVPMTEQLYGQQFFTRHRGRLMATPLFAVLVVIETTDVIFAVDSITGCLRRDQRPVHRLHLERVCDSRTPGALFPAGRHDGQIRLPQVRARGNPDACGSEDASYRHL